ncbi:hypothetical protein LSPH26S_04302 [Lysinibacillus sphaericus]
MQNFTTNKLTFWVLCFFLLVFVELTIFNNGGAFCLLIGAVLLYLSFSKNKRFLKWTGIFFIAIALFTMWSLRLFIVILLLYMLYQYLQRENEPKIVTLEFDKLPATKNELFGTIPAPEDAYKWQDVQIQRLAGDITIDTTQTVLPAGQVSLRFDKALVKYRFMSLMKFLFAYTTQRYSETLHVCKDIHSGF